MLNLFMNYEMYLVYLIGSAYLFAAYKIAVYKNRSPMVWLVLCTLLTPIMFFALLIMKKKQKKL